VVHAGQNSADIGVMLSRVGYNHDKL